MLPSSAVNIVYQGGSELHAMCRPTAPSSRLELIVGTPYRAVCCGEARWDFLAHWAQKKENRCGLGGIVVLRSTGPLTISPTSGTPHGVVSVDLQRRTYQSSEGVNSGPYTGGADDAYIG
ncbi:hypothetical protein CGRA01v4_13047 [Colletotrichum graminicola]|nr:hypothetical protein CGRA01v4_13047 [Colletotrichum graminicola]